MTDEAQPTPENPTTPLGSSRATFSDQVTTRSQQFAADMLQLIPELEGIAIVPSYTIPQDRLPYGVIMGRQGPLRNPGEIMHMAVQLHGCLKIQLDNAFQVLKNIDDYMGEQKAELEQLEQKINDRKQQLADLQDGGGSQPADSAGGGDPASDS